MTFEDFATLEATRLAFYIRRFAAAVDAPRHLWPDLRQAAYVEAWLALRYWKGASDGKSAGGLSAFNWCAGPMRRGMVRAWRASCGAKAYGTDALPKWTSFDDCQPPRTISAMMPETIDLYRALESDPKPSHVMRFLLTTLSPAGGADLARMQGVTKQAISLTNKETRERLKMACS